MKPESLSALAALALFGAASNLSAATAESNLKKTFTAKPGGQLIVDVDRGPIEISTGERDDLQVQVERKIPGVSAANAEAVFLAHEVTLDQDGDRVQVRARFNSGFKASSNRTAQKLQVTYHIFAPRQFNFDLNTGVGHISATQIEGKVKARTGSGALTFSEVNGPFDAFSSVGNIELIGATGVVTAKTGSGSVKVGDLEAETTLQSSVGALEIKSAKALLKAKTGSGPIELGECFGPTDLQTSVGAIHVKISHAALTAQSGSGEIRIDDARDTVRARTSVGAINAGFSAQPKGDCELTTSSGSVQVRLAPDLAFDVQAHTSAGRVTTELPVATIVQGEHKADKLQGKLNGGGKALVLGTGVGQISIKRR